MVAHMAKYIDQQSALARFRYRANPVRSVYGLQRILYTATRPTSRNRVHVVVTTSQSGGALSPLQAADVGETFQLLGKVVFVEDGVGAVFHHLQGHGAEHAGEFIDAF